MEPPALQVIEQGRDDPGKKEKSGDGQRGQRPVEPRYIVDGQRLLFEFAEHLRPQIAAEFAALNGSDRLFEQFFHVVDFFVAHFAITSGRRELSFFRNIRTARKTLTFTSDSEIPAAWAISP